MKKKKIPNHILTLKASGSNTILMRNFMQLVKGYDEEYVLFRKK